jgi:biofilm PGA synthesis protein PgaA
MKISAKKPNFCRFVTHAALCACVIFLSTDAFAQSTAQTTRHHRHVRHHAVAKHSKVVKAAPRPAWYDDYDRAVALARSGQNEAAYAALRPLYQQHSNDAHVTQDYVAVSSWVGGHDDEVISIYRTMPPDQPDYVLNAVAHSYRSLHRPQDAVTVYQYALSRSPSSEGDASGLVRTLTESGYVENAMTTADANMAQYGERLDVLLAAADAADQYDQNAKAMHYYERAVQISPQNTEALQGLIRTEGKGGNPAAALKLADEHPGIISAAEYRRFQGDEAANLVRMGMNDPSTGAGRYATTDRAIAMLNQLIDTWTRQGPDARSDVIRARLDRIVALHNRNLMQDVIDQYNSLINDGVTVPPYIMSSVGDAYMYLHQPEKARDIYLQVLQQDPKNYNVRRQLFYAYVECDDYDNAYATIDALAADQPYWTQIGATDPDASKRRTLTQLSTGSARLFAGQVDEAGARIMPVVNANPNMPEAREALGNLYLAHDWPRAALEQYQIGDNLSGHTSIYNQAGMEASYLRLQDWQQSEAVTQQMVARAPDNLAVERAQRDQDVHNMAEIRVSAGYAFDPMTNQSVNGGSAYGIDTMIYSSPINYNWRIFAGEYYTHQDEVDEEGQVGFSRTTVGAEYRGGPWVANLAPTYNHYNGTDRLGAYGDASYAFNDQWTVAGGGELFSRDTPLRALNQGITANFVGAHAVWQADEAHQLRFGGDVMPFSDGNTRSGLDASYAQQLFVVPHWTIDGLGDVGESQNTKDENRPYYNPKTDFIALIGPRVTNILYERYATVWQQSLFVKPGLYWQDNYGTSATLRMRYEQRVRLNQVFEAGAGVNFHRQAYDGNAENDVALTLDLTGRF